MKPISSEKRKVVNIDEGEFKPLTDDDGRVDGEVFQINGNHELGCGFHIYRMPPGHTTTRHVHSGDEGLSYAGRGNRRSRRICL